jgi:hypothetical protein
MRRSVRATRLVLAVLVCCFTAEVGAQAPLGPTGANSTVWSQELGGTGNAYEVVYVSAGITWFAAHAAALAAGGNLATLEAPGENAFVFDLIDTAACWSSDATFARGPWLGGWYDASFSAWRFIIKSEPFPASNVAPWATGEPEVSTAANRLRYGCAAILGRTPLWDAAVPTDLSIAYVVEYDLRYPCPAPPPGVFELCVSYVAEDGGGRYQLINLPPGTVQGRALFSAEPPAYLGLGPFFGLNPDPLLWWIVFRPPTVGDFFSFSIGDPAEYPFSPIVFPPGTFSPLSGMTLDTVGVVVDGFGVISVTNFVRYTL